MSNRAEPFTASGVILAPDEADEVTGVVYTGFTAVTVFDGHDATGKVLLAGGPGPMTLALNVPVTAEKGVYVQVTGTGEGSVLV